MADDDEVTASSAAVLFCYLFEFNRRQHTVWVKRYLQKRPHYSAFNTLLPDLSRVITVLA